jgi:beta-alanine degradation protein BauB
MHHRTLLGFTVSLVGAGLVLAATPPDYATAPDPLVAYPGNYTVIAENERVRVLDFRLAQGATEAFHRHPANVAVFLGDFKIRFTFPDGRTAIRDAKLGDVGFAAAPVVHASENIGDTDAHGILIELKDGAEASH